MTKDELDALENMTFIARNVAGSFAMRGEYMWDKADQTELDKAEAILQKYGR